MFVEYDESKKKPYILNIIMDKAKEDLSDILKKEDYKPMSLLSFFPVFRDCILGLTFMHINNIVHRDLKPANIMALNSNRFVLADYGEGLNLSFEDEYAKDLFF